MANKLCRIVYVLLCVSLLAWYGWLFPSRVGLIVAVPLLSMGGLMLFTASRGQLVWAGMIVLLLFIHGVTEAMVQPAQRWIGLWVALLSVLYFAGFWVVIRAEKRQRVRNAAAMSEMGSTQSDS